MRLALFWLAGRLLIAQPVNSVIDQDGAGLSIRWQEREQRFYVSLAEKLKTQLPQLPALLSADPPRESDAASMQAHLQLLADLAENKRALPKPMVLLLADRLAAMLGAAWDPRSQPLERDFTAGPFLFGYHYDQLGATWVYDHALARQVYRDYPNTPAGEWAFLTLEKLGWNTSVGCPGDPATFRSVIAESGRFFERHRRSPYRLDFLFDLAQAYETWWALSQARADDEYVVAANYAPGADDARKRAIELYQQILREAPNSDFAAYAKPTLARLQSKLDTGQRQYYCIYD
jgi:tetratricopeptide (TPR) repeat protein